MTTAFDSEAVLMLSAPPMVMESALAAVCAVGVVESVACTVKADVPEVEGVPERMPPVERAKPAGSDPETTVQV